MQPRILVVEDDAELGRTVTRALTGQGFQCTTVATGAAAMAHLTRPPRPDLVLLDPALPDIAGEEVLRGIRRDPSTAGIPVVLVSSKDTEMDRVVGLALGADDYVPRPCSLRELGLRLRAILRRTGGAREAGRAVQRGGLRLDPIARQAWLDGAGLDLTALEFQLLSALVDRQGAVLTREELLARVWGRAPDDLTLRAVDARVKALRRKLGRAADELDTVRGVGYRFGRRADPD